LIRRVRRVEVKRDAAENIGTLARRPALLAALLSVCFVAACGGGGGDAVTAPPPPPPDPYVVAAGTYALLSVNGSLGLPVSIVYTTPAPGGRLDITSGSMVLRADKTFKEVFRFTDVPASGASRADSDVTTGTFTLGGGVIAFSTPDPPNPAHTWSGTLDASGTISYNDQGFQAVYKK